MAVICYASGYGWVRTLFKNNAYGHDSYDDPDTTYFHKYFTVTKLLYYVYLPVLEVDRIVSGREYRLTDIMD